MVWYGMVWLRPLLGYYRHHILVRHHMTQSHPLRHMSSTRTPYQSVLERLLEGAVNLVANILDAGVASHNQSLAEVRFFSFPAE